MASSIAELIAARIEVMPAGERRAARGLKTVADFSARAGVSSPTILRFVSRIGFQNYAEFQSALNDELAEQLQSPASRSQTRKPTPGEQAPLLAATIDNINETFRHLSGRQIADIADLLAEPRQRIHLLGGRFTDPLAAYTAAHLSIVRAGVYHLSGQESLWRDRLIDMGRRDILVIFDIRRYQDSLVRLAEKAQKRGVRVVLLTDQWLSPIARFATHVVAGRTAVPSAWDSSASLFVVCERLIAEVTARSGEAAAARLRDVEALRDG